MKRLFVTLAFAFSLVLGSGAALVSTASAAPITCPAGQTATKTGPGEFRCINNGGQDTGAVQPKGGNKNYAGPPN